ncbi:MAG: SUMF1/EgtB/PvdO family nonheme iron enzyme [Terriglobia bacterium]
MMTHVHDQVETGHALLSRLKNARVETDRLFDLLKPDAWYARPIPERHRIIFYLGHLEAFDLNLLRGHLPDLNAFNPGFDKLFAFGIDPVDAGLPSDQPGDWPSTAEVTQYNLLLRQALDAKLETLRWSNAGANGHHSDFPISSLLNVAIEHRLMHAETLAYMWHQLPREQKVTQMGRQEQSQPAAAPAVGHRMIEIPAGRATLGLSRMSGAFGWDNEYGLCPVEVPAFDIDVYKVTNRQFLQFISAGGYSDPTFWTAEAWKWITKENRSHPVFWLRARDGWRCRTMFDELPLPLDWPVYVSQAEASAYARWAGKKLPTEAQWHRAAYGAPVHVERSYPWGDGFRESGNFDFRRWDPVAVNACPEIQSAFGVHGLLGNGWEWTSSVFEPFPGFEPFPFYPGYSANFFDGQHYVLKGGSARTAACMLRRSFRNWFQPHYPYIYAAFRCVND